MDTSIEIICTETDQTFQKVEYTDCLSAIKRFR